VQIDFPGNENATCNAYSYQALETAIPCQLSNSVWTQSGTSASDGVLCFFGSIKFVSYLLGCETCCFYLFVAVVVADSIDW